MTSTARGGYPPGPRSERSRSRAQPRSGAGSRRRRGPRRRASSPPCPGPWCTWWVPGGGCPRPRRRAVAPGRSRQWSRLRRSRPSPARPAARRGRSPANRRRYR